MRGGKALVDAGRLIRTLTRLSKEEAAKCGIGQVERQLLVRYDDAKNNLTPPREARWFGADWQSRRALSRG